MIPAKIKEIEFPGLTQFEKALPDIQPVMDSKKTTTEPLAPRALRKQVVSKPQMGNELPPGFHVSDYFV